MRTVYVDTNNRCHPATDGTMVSVETDFFDGMCDAFIMGYCLELDENGNIQKKYPWKPYSELDAAQRDYERNQLAEYKALINELYAEVTA